MFIKLLAWYKRMIGQRCNPSQVTMVEDCPHVYYKDALDELRKQSNWKAEIVSKHIEEGLPLKTIARTMNIEVQRVRMGWITGRLNILRYIEKETADLRNKLSASFLQAFPGHKLLKIYPYRDGAVIVSLVKLKTVFCFVRESHGGITVDPWQPMRTPGAEQVPSIEGNP